MTNCTKHDNKDFADVNKVCRLCLLPGALCRSHIVPEFVFKPMYDHKHRFFVMSNDPETPTTHKQRGLTERLLCKRCETHLSRFENYVRKLFYGGVEFNGTIEGNVYRMSEIQYTELKLCFLSILWRMSVSSLPLFAEVHLGPHEEPLRKMILAGEPGPASRYGFACLAPEIDGKVYSDLVLQPTLVRNSGHHFYRLVIGGLVFIFVVSGHNIEPFIQRFFVQEDGTWLLVKMDISKIDFLYQWLTETARKGV